MNKIESQRIQDIIEAITKVATGDFSVQVDITDEFNDLDALAVGFNMMIDDLREKYLIQKENEYIKQLNEELEVAKEKAEESDKLKSAFLANVSHEIRTPMNGIIGFTNLLKHPGLSQEKRLEFIRFIKQSGQRLLNLIDDIINISKVEAGQQDILWETVNINYKLVAIYDTFRFEAETKGIAFSYHPGLPDNEASVRTDKDKFFGILSNLVKNAIRYTETGSVEFGYTKKNDMLEFYVLDTGIGVPEDKQKAIFERFFRTEKANRISHSGAGLGLSIAKAYADMLGGNIWMENRKQGGAAFYFDLPYFPKEGHTLEKTVERNWDGMINGAFSDLPKLTVLIAEDDDISYKLLTQDLNHIAKKILRATTGFEVLNIYHRYPDIDLILMDMSLSGLDGYEATRQIRILNKHVVIIAQTAFAQQEDRIKALDAGCNDYLSKPVDQAELYSIMNKYMKKNS